MKNTPTAQSVFVKLATVGTALFGISASVLAFDPAQAPATAGILDEAIVAPSRSLAPGVVVVPASPLAVPGSVTSGRELNLISLSPAARQQAVQDTVEQEIEVLETLPIQVLEGRANEGERAAQIVLGTEFAKEAQSLVGIPAAANQAAEDAVRWYSLAARRGFPGAVSLDYAGISFYPIRVQR